MDELISKQAAIDALDGVKVDEENCTEYDIGYNDGIDFAVSRLSVLPSAHPKRGKWSPADSLHHGAPFYFCSECGEKMLSTVMGNPRWNFCPNCGAKMEVTE